MTVVFRNAFIVFFSILLFTSCNLIEHAEKKSVHQLTKQSIQEYTFSDETYTLHGYHGGKGPLLIFIHGFGGDAQLSWKQTLIDFSKNYTVVAMDLLWFGKSQSNLPANLNSQSKALSYFLHEVIPGIDTMKYTLIGHSYGGFVALDYHHTISPAEKLVIIDSPGMTYDANKLKDLEQTANVEHYWDLFVLQKPEDIIRLNKMAFLKPPHVPKFLLDDIYEKYFANHHKELTSLLTTLPDEQEKFMTKEFNFVPSLVIWGDQDLVFPLSEGEKLATYLNATFEVIPETGHSAPFENYELFKTILNRFLEEK